MMKFETRSKEPVPVSNQDIVIDGQCVGELKENRDDGKHRYHAIFRVGRGFELTLAQGFGDTPEEAIRNAIITSRKEAVKYLEGVDELACRLGVEVEGVQDS